MREEAPSRAQRVIDNNDILFQCVRPYQKNNYIHRILNTSNQQWVASTGYAQIRTTKLLQKREMRKDIVIELSYKGFSRASDYS